MADENTQLAPGMDIPDSPPAVYEADDQSFDKNLADFLGSTMDSAMDEEERAARPPAPAVDLPSGGDAPAPDETIIKPAAPAAAPAAPPSPPAPVSAAPPAAASGAAEPAAIDPALVAAVLMGTPAPGAAPAAPAPAAAPTAAPAAPQAAPAQAAEPEVFAPFPQNLTIPAGMQQALFESEDTNVRAQALGVLMSATANAVIAQVERRMQDHWQGRFVEAAASQQNAATEARRIQDDFFEAFPDLKAPQYKELIARASNVVTQMNPSGVYTSATRDQIGGLVRQVAKQIGLQGAPGGAPAPAPSAPAVPHFASGGARPAGHGQPEKLDGPSQMFFDLAGAAGFGT